MEIEYKGCDNCKYTQFSSSDVPCNSCKRNNGEEDNWEPKENSENVMSFPPKFETKDNVNHPSHYEQSCSLECIEAMELVFDKEVVHNFCLLNAWKYIWRYKNKNGIEDLKKARWYIDRCKDYIENPDVYADFKNIVDNIDQWLLSHNII